VQKCVESTKFRLLFGPSVGSDNALDDSNPVVIRVIDEALSIGKTEYLGTENSKNIKYHGPDNEYLKTSHVVLTHDNLGFKILFVRTNPKID
jgi:hypothetical protein